MLIPGVTYLFDSAKLRLQDKSISLFLQLIGLKKNSFAIGLLSVDTYALFCRESSPEKVGMLIGCKLLTKLNNSD